MCLPHILRMELPSFSAGLPASLVFSVGIPEFSVGFQLFFFPWSAADLVSEPKAVLRS